MFAVTLISEKPLQVPRRKRVRVTALAGTSILDASPDSWSQVDNFPTSVTWTPAPSSIFPTGDPSDSWVIDNDFVLSLGPVNAGIKKIKIEWLSRRGRVLDIVEVSIPCLTADEIDFEADWRKYSKRVKGGKKVFAYLEPIECDQDELNHFKLSCKVRELVHQRHCEPDSSGNNRYSVTLAAPSGSWPSGYRHLWTIFHGTTSSSFDTGASNLLTTPLVPGSYTVQSAVADASGNVVRPPCDGEFDLPTVDAVFTWKQAECSTRVDLVAEVDDEVAAWTWESADLSIGIPAGRVTSFTPSVGTYGVTLNATDRYGCVWTTFQKISVVECQASFDFGYSWCVAEISPKIREDVEVTFTNTSTGCMATWLWDFGDGSTSTDRDPQHTFRQVRDGDFYDVTLTMTQAGCQSTVRIPVTFVQRKPPNFQVEVCPDGKVIVTTSEPDPVWFPSGNPETAPRPYTKRDGSREIYRYVTDGTYTMTLVSKTLHSNVCETTVSFIVARDCCAKNARVSGKGIPMTASVRSRLHPNKFKTKRIRVMGRLIQHQDPLTHTVAAKTILQYEFAPNVWFRLQSRDVDIKADFTGTIYRSQIDDDHSYYTGCNCKVAQHTAGSANNTNITNIRVDDPINARFRAKKDSITSKHEFTVAGVTSTPLSLTLGKQSDCSRFKWWKDWF